MPVYEYGCAWGHRFDVWKKVAELDRVEACPVCGASASRRISLPMVAVDYQGYVSPSTGKWVEGKGAHIEDLKRSGCRIYEPGETEAYIKNLPKRNEQLAEKAIDKAVNAAAQELGLMGY
jgi:putative FmdB family regulatory protein